MGRSQRVAEAFADGVETEARIGTFQSPHRLCLDPESIAMSDGMKWAHRFRLELSFEIELLETGARKVMEVTREGTIDITSQFLAAQKDRFEHLEQMIETLGGRARD